MSRVEHGERIRSRQREIILRVTLIFVSLILLAVSTVLLAGTARDKPREEAEGAQNAPEVRVIVRYATEEEQEEHDQDILLALARTVWGEARGCTTTEQAAVVWCVLNRVDSQDFPDDILEVLEQPNQFFRVRPRKPRLARDTGPGGGRTGPLGVGEDRSRRCGAGAAEGVRIL